MCHWNGVLTDGMGAIPQLPPQSRGRRFQGESVPWAQILPSASSLLLIRQGERRGSQTENIPFGREHWSRAQNLISIHLGHALNSSPGRWSLGFCPGISTPGGSSGSQAHCAANLPGMCHCGLQFCL
ncbi:unnamed protein product [Rangifer tarandus platyrhynchus]|uniref:Uncharacterized protein n=1 Tax=Rangifer tarandus platyrhynchus TaxID=3082113 RepID=A0AC59YZ60_RANTA